MKAKHTKALAEQVVKDIRRATRKQYSAQEKIRIVLEAGMNLTLALCFEVICQVSSGCGVAEASSRGLCRTPA